MQFTIKSKSVELHNLLSFAFSTGLFYLYYNYDNHNALVGSFVFALFGCYSRNISIKIDNEITYITKSTFFRLIVYKRQSISTSNIRVLNFTKGGLHSDIVKIATTDSKYEFWTSFTKSQRTKMFNSFQEINPEIQLVKKNLD